MIESVTEENAVHELEKETGIRIFNRTNKGVSISKEGEEFLGYARQVLEQAAILEDKYKGNQIAEAVLFCVGFKNPLLVASGIALAL